jgi:hypothetical protein
MRRIKMSTGTNEGLTIMGEKKRRDAEAKRMGLVEVLKHLAAKIKTCKTDAEREVLLEEIKNDYRATVCAAKAFVEKATGRMLPEQGEDDIVIMKEFYRLQAPMN